VAKVAVSRPTFVLSLLTVLWVVTAIMDGQRLMTGYVLGASFQGEAPITEHIEFALTHKVAVILFSCGILAGTILALLKGSHGILLAGVSAAALLAVGIWSVDEYGTLGAPLSLAQALALVAIAFVSYRQSRKRKGKSDAT
jgi:hypothetical protein